MAYKNAHNLLTQFPTVTVCHGDDMQTVDSWTLVEKFYTMASSHELEDKVWQTICSLVTSEKNWFELKNISILFMMRRIIKHACKSVYDYDTSTTVWNLWGNWGLPWPIFLHPTLHFGTPLQSQSTPLWDKSPCKRYSCWCHRFDQHMGEGDITICASIHGNGCRVILLGRPWQFWKTLIQRFFILACTDYQRYNCISGVHTFILKYPCVYGIYKPKLYHFKLCS